MYAVRAVMRMFIHMHVTLDIHVHMYTCIYIYTYPTIRLHIISEDVQLE